MIRCGLEIQRSYLTRNGAPLDLSTVTQGDLIVLKTQVRSVSGSLENVVIQRSRETCRRLAAAAGQELCFPIRRPPQCVEITLPGEPASGSGVEQGQLLGSGSGELEA